MKILLFLCGLLLPVWVGGQDCTIAQYQKILTEADQATAKGQYELAINKLQSAKTCRPEKEVEVSRKILVVFDKVNGERQAAIRNAEEARRQQQKAEAEARRIYANDLAFKSQTALQNGDLNTAFRLTEFACRYVDTSNLNVLQALVDAVHHGNNNNLPFLPRAGNIIGHPTDVVSLAYSPDGKKIAVRMGDGGVKIWDWKTGILQMAFNGDAYSHFDVAFSTDGNRIVTGLYADHSVKVWDCREGKRLRTIPIDQAGTTSCMEISPDGKWVAFGYPERIVKIWNCETGLLSATLAGHPNPINHLAFSPDTQWLAVGTKKKKGWLESGERHQNIMIWDWRKGTLVSEIKDLKEEILFDMAFSPKSQWIAIAIGNDLEIRDWQSGETRKRIQWDSKKVPGCITFSPDGKLIAGGDMVGNKVRIWDWENEVVLNVLEGHTGFINDVKFAANGKYLASASNDFTTRVWDIGNLTEKKVFPNPGIQVKRAAFTPDNRLMALHFEGDSAYILDVESGKQRLRLPIPKGTRDMVFSPDGNLFSIWFSDDSVSVWDITSGKRLANTYFKSTGFSGLCITSQNDIRMVTSDTAGFAIVNWNLKEKTQMLKFKMEEKLEAIKDVDFSPDGRKVVFFFTTKAILGDLTNKDAPVKILMDDILDHTSETFSPDSRYIALGYSNGLIKIRSALTGKILSTFGITNTEIVHSLNYSADGKFLASWRENHIDIWDVKREIKLLTLAGTGDFVFNLMLSSNGGRLAAICDNVLKVWELNAESLINYWKKTGLQASLLQSQIERYDLGRLPEIHRVNEFLLLTTRETWQIAAFADLYAQKIAETGFPEKADYERALRLYDACLSHDVDNDYFQQKIDALNALWIEKTDKK